MRKYLLASTCLVAVIALPARAETSIATATTDPIRTSTIDGGGADDIRITSAGSVQPTAGIAVTVDSDNILINDGTIEIGNADNATAILAESGVTGTITNSATGKIILDEPYAPTDADNDGDIDGPFATGTGRTGIATAGAFNGNITNSGTITIEGNDSAGIRLGGPLAGNFVHDGTTTVLGDNALGVSLQDITGDVRIAGTITVQGLDAVAARVDGNVDGALVVQGSLQSTGYRYATAPADSSKLDADDLLQGGPTLSIAGNVSGGIILAVPPKDNSATDNDEDDDGIEDSKEGSALVRSYGAAPAMRIGDAGNAVTIGAIAGTGTGFGLVIDGGVLGSGVYSGINAGGLQIGGLGGTVTIDGGIGISATGSIKAVSNGGSATAVQLGSGATTPEIRNAGTIEATGGSITTSISTAISISAGANLATIRNSGTIGAKAGGNEGTAIALMDSSGTVELIENSGTIAATGALASSGRNVAIDLSANDSGATVRQTAVAASAKAPSIIGDVRFGNGNDIFEIADGSMRGSSSFGAGDNQLNLSGDAVYAGKAEFGADTDILALSGTAVFDGNVDFGGGADMLDLSGTSRYSGSLTNAQGLAVTASGGTFDVTGAAQIASLAITDDAVLGVTLGGTNDTALQVSGDASFGAGSKLAIKLSNVQSAEGDHVVVQAGTITGATNLTASTALLPFLYKGSLSSNANQVVVSVARKDATELGLNRSEASGFAAAYAALQTDEDVEGLFLAIADQQQFRNQLQQMLPEHEGGIFENVTLGSRAMARFLADPSAPFKDEGKWGYWVAQVGWGSSKSVGDTAGYDVGGWGISAGAEHKTGIGNFGASVGYIHGKNDNASNGNEVWSEQWELAGYWRLAADNWLAHARISGAKINFDGNRYFVGELDGEDITKTMTSDWGGTLWSASGAVARDMRSGNFSIRPTIAVEYFKLSEDGYAESGGGEALDLTVADRESDELAVSGTISMGLDLGGVDQYDGWYRFELEAGRREIVGGSLGVTVAQFENGSPFTLVPEERKSGWIGRLRAVAGNSAFQIGGEVSVEEQQSHAAVAVRASLRVGL
ncbi:autotransporter domain-containing protein [uncultured Parasphingorhabdus sp.]|uniref:autotransporter outer membrane beta-barrel domain-containing protein n=1 Tax=uncultured Parasphingorhabdus sp. TaxID=2709694 RepID=UPI002AA61113|nr:autotransporter domain-containing protein [uncultured Parasphingorhabdus sp.]